MCDHRRRDRDGRGASRRIRDALLARRISPVRFLTKVFSCSSVAVFEFRCQSQPNCPTLTCMTSTQLQAVVLHPGYGHCKYKKNCSIFTQIQQKILLLSVTYLMELDNFISPPNCHLKQANIFYFSEKEYDFTSPSELEQVLNRLSCSVTLTAMLDVRKCLFFF